MTQENPLLKRIKLPGRRFRLPSKGLFYKNGELDESVVDGEVEVFSMTTVDEINLRTPELLFNGEAVRKVFKRCIPEVKEPFKLLSNDVDFLLGCLRVVSYGNEITVDTYCPKCEERQLEENQTNIRKFCDEAKKYTEENGIDYDEFMEDPVNSKKLDMMIKKRSTKQHFNINLNSILQNKTTELEEDSLDSYYLKLSNGDEVFLKPMILENAVSAYQLQSNKQVTEDADLLGDYLSFIIAASIDHVNETYEIDYIVEWAKELPIKLKQELVKQFENLQRWGTDYDYTLTCQTPNCGHTWGASALLNPIGFFMQPSDSVE